MKERKIQLKKSYKVIACLLAIIFTMTALTPSLGVFALDADSAFTYRPATEKYSDVQHLREVKSSDQNITASFWLDSSGTPYYEIDYKGKSVVENSKLGMELDYGTFNTNFELLSVTANQVDSSWTDLLSERKQIPNQYNEAIVHLKSKGDGTKMDVVLRAYNEGVTFRYVFPQDNVKPQFVIKQELTYFNLDNTATAYVHLNGNQTHAIKTPVSELKAVDRGYFRPLTLIGNGYALSITEANQVDYTRVHFTQDGAESGTIRTLFNGVTTNSSLDPTQIKNEVDVNLAKGDFASSWRTFVIGGREGDLLNHNYLVKNLNPPSAIADTSWIEPGKALRVTTLNTAGAKQRIDYAAEHNITYAHFDAGWYGPEGNMSSDPWQTIAGLDYNEIKAYADARNIKLVVYVNFRHLQDQWQKGQLDALFKHYVNDWGIDGIKFGFVPIGSQATTKMVYDWVKIAADNKLVVDIHDEMLPTGYERTYPNLLTLEAIHGDEENPLASEDLGYLFTRMVAGAADHTWCYALTRNTSRAFRMAGSLMFYSPLQYLYWYDAPTGGTAVKPEVKLWDDMPTVWDESDYIESKMEEYATVLRRSGGDFYLSSLSAVERNLAVNLSFLTAGTPYRAEIYTNPSDETKVNDVLVDTFIVNATMALSRAMHNNTGFAVRFTPATADDLIKYPLYTDFQDLVVEVITAIQGIGAITRENLAEKEAYVNTVLSKFNALPAYAKLLVTNYDVLVAAINQIEELKRPATDLLINGKSIEGFAVDKFSYEVQLRPGDLVPEISLALTQGSQVTAVKQVSALPGSASITAANAFKSVTYTVNFKTPSDERVLYLSDMTPSAKSDRGECVKDKARSGNPLTGRDGEGKVVTFEKGIGSHAITGLTYDITDLGVEKFQAFCSISTYNGNTTNRVAFQVFIDGVSVYDSGNMTQMSSYGVIDVAVPENAKTIRLLAKDGGDGINFDHANWCDAKILLSDRSVNTAPLRAMIEKAKALYGQLGEVPNKALLGQAVEDAQAVLHGQLSYAGIYAAAVTLGNVIAMAEKDLCSMIFDKEKVAVNETFGVTVQCSAAVRRILVANANGQPVSLQSLVSTAENGKQTITATMKVGTAGKDRQFTLLLDYGDGKGYVAANASAFMDVTLTKEAPAVVKVQAPATVKANVLASYAITTNAEGSYSANIYSGSSKLGKTIVSKTMNADGTCTWVLGVKIGSAGYRSLDAYAGNVQGEQSAPYPFQVAVTLI